MIRPSRAGGAALALLAAGCATIPSAPDAGVAPVPPPAAAPRPPEPATLGLPAVSTQGAFLTGTVPPGTATLTLDGAPIGFAPDGRFILAFDRDAGPRAVLLAHLADGRTLVRTIAVAPRAWDVQSIPNLPRGTTPSPDFLARRKLELARIDAARARETGADGWRQRFVWPVTGRISGVFGSQRIYAGEPGAYHAGVDVARPTGTPIVAPADGVVILAADAPFSLEGNLLMVDHGMRLNSAFLHLSRILVREGELVRQGQVIGLIGQTGRATGPHLHWAIKWRDRRIDPAPLAGPMPKPALP